MEHAEYERQMEAIKAATARIFAMAETEEEVCRLEKAINHEVMYLAAIAQSELVKPEGGWDPVSYTHLSPGRRPGCRGSLSWWTRARCP